MAPKTRPCPQCRKPAATTDNPARPFCSERCKLNDLSRWLGGEYVISTPLPGPPGAWDHSGNED